MRRGIFFLISKIKLFFSNPGYVISSIFLKARNTLDKVGIIKIKRYDLIIIDEVFPFETSLFRYNEFNSYYASFERIKVYTTGWALALLSPGGNIRKVVREYKLKFPGREIGIFNPHRAVKARLAYCLFLNNTFWLLDYFENNNLPFAFCLYPGGGFSLTSAESEMMIRKIVASRMFKRVIVTQNVTKKYLLEKEICPEERISFIYGVVSSGTDKAFAIDKKKYLGKGKNRLDICFVANKYTEGGADKGFDIFQATALLLLKAHIDVEFHIVGTFSEADLLNAGCPDRFKFYGSLKAKELRSFFDGMDIILSPNRINILISGGFDGFPTGSCIEGALRGVLMMVSDELGQNIYYRHGQDILIINNKPECICDCIVKLYNDPPELWRLAQNGFWMTSELFSEDYQISKRKAILEELMLGNDKT
jgi:glycosyltransferase involved in cell wall biosynthesis